jgi:hypothetical protein
MSYLLVHQLPLILVSFLAGIAGWLAIARRPAASRAWKYADFLWIALGGFGAIAAVIAGLYRADTARVERQIDLAFAASRAFDRDAARFRLSWCETPDATLAVLCDKADFLSASTALNRDLPLFLDITSVVTPLQSLRLFAGRDRPDGKMAGMADLAEQADAFDTVEILSFAPRDEATDSAVKRLRETGRAAVAAEFLVLAQSYEELIGDVISLKKEWDYLRANTVYLKIQVLAFCLIAFAAPFRIGKTISELS